MKIKNYSLLPGLAAGLFMCLASNVANAAFAELQNGILQINTYVTSNSTDVVIGPNAIITVNGDWFITASNVYINPGATINGTGTIHLMNPTTNGSSAAATTLDAGGITIGCKLSLENPNTIILGIINPAVSYPSTGIIDPGTATGTNDLVMGNNLNFGMINAHLVLNNSNLIFTAGTPPAVMPVIMPTVTRIDLNNANFAVDPAPGADYQAYIVTNGANTGVVTKQGLGLAGTTSFTYPVGQSGPLAMPYDYTPATITNNSGVARAYSVRVSSYANSTPIEYNTTKGVNRTFQITSDATSTATLALTTNDVTGNNIGTDGSAFNPAAAYITQGTASGGWTVSTTTQNGGTPINVLTGSFTVPTSGPTSYFSKTSDINSSLNRVVPLATKLFLEAVLIQDSFTNGNLVRMRNYLQKSGLLPTTSPFTSAPATYAQINNTAGPAGTIADWILVQVVNATTTPTTVLQQRSLLLKTDGSVVDVEGNVPTFFDQSSTTVRVIYIPRHHMRVATTNYVSGVNSFTGSQTYDFTTGGQSKAFGGTTNPQLILVNVPVPFGVYAFFAGDNISDGSIDISDFSDVDAQNANGIFGGYFRQDLSNDGAVDITDFSFVDKNNATGIFFNF